MSVEKQLKDRKIMYYEPRCLEKTLRWYIHTALAQGRPLDARVGGRYRRIVEAGDPMDIVPETGEDWSKQGGY
jgi:hypothetical protein